MILNAIQLASGLAILAAQAFALLLMILGAIDLHGHIQEKKRKGKRAN